MVQFETDCADKEEFKTLAKDIAMQVAANAPQYTSKEDVPAEVVENEKKIQLAAAMNEGKPQNIAEKMVMGRMGKFYAEICLVEQESIKEEKTSVAKVVENVAKQLGGSIKVVKFVRYERGEGIEKRADDFANEVASMIK
jgi:elongation factor Ts